jgi:hypothetical protein
MIAHARPTPSLVSGAPSPYGSGKRHVPHRRRGIGDRRETAGRPATGGSAASFGTRPFFYLINPPCRDLVEGDGAAEGFELAM